MIKQSRIRVLIVDDHAAMRLGLAAFFEVHPDIELVGAMDGGEKVLQQCLEAAPDVILMDIMMPRMDGVATTRAIHAQYPHIRIVALTSFVSDERVKLILEAGATSCLSKDVSSDELVQAIRLAMVGTSVLSPSIRQFIFSAKSPDRSHDLSERELEIIGLVACGLNNSQIGEKLYLSRNTVKTHVSNILLKLGATSRMGAVMQAIAFGLIPSHSNRGGLTHLEGELHPDE